MSKHLQDIYDYVRITVLACTLVIILVIASPFLLFWYMCMIIGFPVVCILSMCANSYADDFLDDLHEIYVKPWKQIIDTFKEAFK